MCLFGRIFLFILRNWGPGFVRIKALHVLEFIEGFWSKILLVDNAVVADDEGSHSGHGVLDRCSHQGKAPDHYAFHNEIHFAERRCGSLSFQNLEEITVLRLRTGGVSLFDCFGNLVAHRPSPGTVGVLQSKRKSVIGSHS
jgi:hypothetical protein